MAPDATNPWDLARSRLRAKLDEHSYKNWFSQTHYQSYENGRLVVEVPSRFFAEWLRDHYLDTISECAKEVLPDFKELTFKPSTDNGSAQGAAPRPAQVAPPPGRKGREKRQEPRVTGLNARYTFERFVVGAGNRFAHAAARAVAESPSRAYNPLFLYGGTGLGKTHLMHAIGHEMARRQAGRNVVLVSSEYFTNQLIDSIATKTTQKFRAKYRKADVLLIDDIHFIAGKEATQEEFFHTFNALFDMHKQIVISSDRQPKEIGGLEKRLVSRFEWGLVTDIQPPDLETRVAILKSKALEDGRELPPDVLRYIALYITSNIRELEGALVTVLAYSKLTEQPVTMKLAEEVLHDLIGREKIKPTTVEGVQRAVAEHFDVRISDLRGRSRQKQVAGPRHIAMYLCKQHIPSMSLNEIGEAFGGKDHTTVIHACRRIEKAVKEDPRTRQTVGQLEKTLHGG